MAQAAETAVDAPQFTPQISRALAQIASGLELTPAMRTWLAEQVPPGAATVADLPEDLRWILAQLEGSQDQLTGEDTAQAGDAELASRRLTLAGRPLAFTTLADPPVRTRDASVEACGPGFPVPGQQPNIAPPGIDPDDDGSELEAQGLPQHWRGLLVPFDVAAPDGRIIKAPADGVIKSRDMPLPLTAQVATADGHDNSVLIGRTNRIWAQDGALWGEGDFDLGTEEGRDWAGRVGRGMAGWGSVDLDAGAAPTVQSQGAKKVPKRTYSDWSFAGFTLVSRPAFDAARIGVWDGGDPAGVDGPDEMDGVGVRDDDAGDDTTPRGGPAQLHPSSYVVPREVAELLDTVKTSAPVSASNGGCGCGGALEADEAAVTFPASGKGGLPLAKPGGGWDGAAAEKRVRAWAGAEGDDLDWGKYGQAFFWKAPDASKLGDFKLPFADVIDGKLTAVPGGVFAAAAAIQGSRGGVSIPPGDVAGVKAKIGAYYRAMKRKAPWDSASTAASLAASLNSDHVVTVDGMHGQITGYDLETGWLRITCGQNADLLVPADDLAPQFLTAAAIAGPAAPPEEWFDNPQLSGPTALQVDDDGRVYGHLATWGTCHVAFSDVCVNPPKSNTDYSYFHVGETVTASGKRIPVGKIVMGPGHAGPYAGWRAATMHYDKSGATVAVGRIYEDAHGIAFAGGLVPEVTPSQVASLRRSPLSGDWRKIGGNLELVAALAVSVPGFPVPRPRAGVAYKSQASLTAAGVIDPQEARVQNGMLGMIEAAVENVLEGYAARRARASAALERIQAASSCGCTDGEHGDEEEETD